MAKLARLPVSEGALGSSVASIRRNPRARPRYFAFLSYSHKDEEIADWLHRELEEFRVPAALAGKLTANGVTPKRLTPIFRDQHELAAADDLSEEIEEALSSSQFLIVLCSPNAAGSRWTNAEIEVFKRARPDGCVLAAITAGEPFASEMPGRADEECFPPALRQKYDRRGRPTGKRAEPLAADLREEGDGRRMGFLKLVAGMLGVGLDDLVQRETTRRHRRLAWLAAGSLAGMAVTTTLAITAIQARDAARDQRREAEGLVAFMVGDLRDKLEPIGRLDALDGVGARVLSYYQKQDTSELNDAALLQRSRALNLMAEVAYLRGHLDEADKLYRQAAAGTAEAVRRSPEDTKRLFDHAQNVFSLGEIARFQGRTKQAETNYREYKRLADQLVAIDPNNMKWRMESLYGDENIGIALLNERRFAEAARQFTGGVRPIENLASIDPENESYRKELATLLAWLADAHSAQGNLDSAIAVRQRQISLLDRSLASGATDVEFHEYLIPAHQALGRLLVSRGQAERGIAELRSAITEADRLIPTEPANNNWKSLAASARLEYARDILATGRRDEAVQQTEMACGAVADLRARKSTDSRLGSLQTNCLTMRARLALQAGGTAQALALAQQALASSRAEHTADPIRDLYSVAAACRLVGDVRRRMDDFNGAKAIWAEGLASLPRGVSERPQEMQERAALLRRAGQGAQAAALEARLKSMGYHDTST